MGRAVILSGGDTVALVGDGNSVISGSSTATLIGQVGGWRTLQSTFMTQSGH